MESFVHETSVVDPGARIGPGTRIWHFCHIMGGAEIGPACNLGQNVFVAAGCRIGRGVKIQNNVSIYAGVQLADYVFVGPSVVFTNVMTPRSEVDRHTEYLPTPVGRGASIGANATIVCGHRIGQYAMIGAGSVVTRDVPAFALVAGNPARLIGWVSRHGERLGFDASGLAVCPATGERYRLNDDGTVCRD